MKVGNVFSSARWVNITDWAIDCIGTQQQNMDYYTGHINVAHLAKGHDQAGEKGNWKMCFKFTLGEPCALANRVY